MTILDDPVRPFDPSPRLELVDAEPEGMTFFGLASRGGYVRNVTGTVAYLDEQAAIARRARLPYVRPKPPATAEPGSGGALAVGRGCG